MDRKIALEAIDRYVDGHADEIVEFLKKLISIRSVTYEEGEAVAFFAGKLREFGFDEVRVDAVGNVLGRVGSGKTTLLYDAHIDTVEPGSPDAWGMNPLEAQLTDGVMRGRGAVDDKGCLTAAAFAGRALKALDLCADFTLWISGSISEEDVEGSCVEAMLKESPDIRPDYVLVAESSDNRIVRGHKGRALIKIDVPGKCAHASAAWRGENALIKALPVMERIDRYDDFVEDAFLGRGTIEVTKVECDAPSLNTIPGAAVITCDRRISCAESIEDLLAEIEPMIADVKGASARIDREHVTTYTGYRIECTDYFPSWVMPQEHPLVQAGVAAYRDTFRREPVVGRWDFCTNATHLCGRMGIPAIGYGPGDSSLCHSTDDKVPMAELLDAIRFYAALPLYVKKHA